MSDKVIFNWILSVKIIHQEKQILLHNNKYVYAFNQLRIDLDIL